MDQGGLPQESFTFPLFSSVEVLATGKAQRGSGGNIESYSTVTLNVTPQQANDIIAAKAEAKVTAVLRSQRDDFPNTSQATSVSDVVAAAARLKRLNTTEYIVGGRGTNGGASIVTSVPVTSAIELPGESAQSKLAAPFPTLSAIE
jgi:pilus assembly protein CpaB